ncbi:hypothetical protein SADUNF_Sadunf04G0092700 [Salix dunnii]|uniref:Pentatricopeptide repeat-containing protein n=1 Tax=Salix dunnii TaxID=1413687 RepID=A0A835K6S9_9ROSI|nr:hypothetical protein SADUNF_Sadunf04G0092700 [Salix dunnii]
MYPRQTGLQFLIIDPTPKTDFRAAYAKASQGTKMTASHCHGSVPRLPRLSLPHPHLASLLPHTHPRLSHLSTPSLSLTSVFFLPVFPSFELFQWGLACLGDDAESNGNVLKENVDVDGYKRNALEFFVEMHNKSDDIGIDDFSKLSNLCYGRQLHSYMVKTGNDRSGFVVSYLIDMYSKCGCYKEACGIFRVCEKKGGIDLVSKNAMVAACCREGEMELALQLFWRGNELNDSVSWNTLIFGYVQNGYPLKALKLIRAIPKAFRVTMSDQIITAKEFLANIEKRFVKNEKVKIGTLLTSLISMKYKGKGNVREYILEMSHLASKLKALQLELSEDLLVHLEEERLKQDRTESAHLVATFKDKGRKRKKITEVVGDDKDKDFVFEEEYIDIPAGVIHIGQDSNFDHIGKEMHAWILKNGLSSSAFVESDIVDVYCKCGNMKYAESLLLTSGIGSSFSITSMIVGYSSQGNMMEACRLFDSLKEKN